MATHSAVVPFDTNHAQGFNRVLSGCLRNPVCLKRFRINLPSQLTIPRDCLARSLSSLLCPKPHCKHYEMLLLVGRSIRDSTASAVYTHDLGPGA